MLQLILIASQDDVICDIGQVQYLFDDAGCMIGLSNCNWLAIY